MKSSKPPVVRGEWNLEPSGMEMIQVKELLEAIDALKKEGVTGASVMFSFTSAASNPSNRDVAWASSTPALLTLLACAQRRCQMKSRSSGFSGCCWT
jgi:hypothetical protein